MTTENSTPAPAQTPAPSRIPVPATPRGRFWMATLLGAVILVCGMAIGSGGTILWIWHRMNQFQLRPERMPMEHVERVRSKLNLTDAQTAQVAEILRKRHEAMMRTLPAMFKAELEGMRAEVAAVLTPEQAATWNRDFESILRVPPFPPPPPPHHGGPHGPLPPPPSAGEAPPPGPGPWPGR